MNGILFLPPLEGGKRRSSLARSSGGSDLGNIGNVLQTESRLRRDAATLVERDIGASFGFE